MFLEQQLSERLKPKGFHGFTRHVKTGIVAFFGPDGYTKQYDVVPLKKSRIELLCNAKPISDFDNADDLADFLLI